MGIKEELTDVVGLQYLHDSPEVLSLYSKDYSLSPPGSPNYVVQPENAQEVQDVVRLAARHMMPLIPCSSGVHFHGSTIPTQGGIVLDLKRMNRVLEVDKRNRRARIEPGVTWGQLQGELEKHSLMAMIPLLPHPRRSVLASYLEREAVLIPKFEYGEPLLTMEVVLPSGDLFRTGSACVPGATATAVSDGVQPEGPGLDFWRLFQGAQGTMGVVTWANVKVEYLPQVNKVFFIPFSRLEEAVEPVYRIQKRMLGQECFLLNGFDLAAIVADKWPQDFDALRQEIAPWVLVIVLSGGRKYPEDKVKYEEEALREIGAELTIPDIPAFLPGVPRGRSDLVKAWRLPWSEGRPYWKHCYRGGCQDLVLVTTLDKAPAFTQTIMEVAGRSGYPATDLGFYVQPLERARACHYECHFFYDPADVQETEKARRLFLEVAEHLLEEGAFFSRPYGPLAELVYRRAASYTTALKKVKALLDPNNIMNPGKLCF